jgi:tripartite-type tricarboxylate transporter receptor subunit TctC
MFLNISSVSSRLATLLKVTIASLVFLSTIPAAAQGYPSKPLKLVIGFAAGGPTDIIARTFAKQLSIQLGVPVVVDNRAGADSLLASQVTMQAEPDGYTIYLASTAHAINPSLFSNAGFDAVKDFTQISMVGDIPNLIVVSPALPVQTLGEFIAYAKARKGELNYATSASVIYLATEMMTLAAGIELQRIAFKGAAPAIPALVGNEVQLMISGIGPLLPLTRAGKLKALAVTSEKRSLLAPDIPTAIEAGLPGYTSSVWYALLAPPKMPRELAERLNSETRKVLANPDVRKTLLGFGVEPMATSQAELQNFMASEVQKWRKVVVDTGAKSN